MLNLVCKDILQHKRLILIYAAIGGFFVLAMTYGGMSADTAPTTFLMMAGYGFAIRSTYDEDKSGFQFLKSLPLSDEAIVMSKFLSTLAVTVFYALFFQAISFLSSTLSLSTKTSVGFSEIAFTLAIVFGVLMVFLGFYLTLFFLLGFAKASTYSRLSLFILFGVIAVGLKAVKIPAGVEQWVSRLEMNNSISIAVAVIGLAIYALSCMFSISRVRTRDWS